MCVLVIIFVIVELVVGGLGIIVVLSWCIYLIILDDIGIGNINYIVVVNFD